MPIFGETFLRRFFHGRTTSFGDVSNVNSSPATSSSSCPNATSLTSSQKPKAPSLLVMMIFTKLRNIYSYYWPGMDSNITIHIKLCHCCQLHCKDHCPPPALLLSLPQPTKPSLQLHADLLGPLKMSDNCKKFILCMTYAFTKYAGQVLIQIKEADTVKEAIFF